MIDADSIIKTVMLDGATVFGIGIGVDVERVESWRITMSSEVHAGPKDGNKCICFCVYCERGECESCDFGPAYYDQDPNIGARY